MFAESKSENGMACVPTITWLGNRADMAATMMAHNLTRELTVSTQTAKRDRAARRTPLWRSAHSGSVRRQVTYPAGRLIRPLGKLTSSVSSNVAFRREIGAALGKLERAA